MNKLLRISLLAAAFAVLFSIYGYGANTTIQGIATTIVLPNATDYIPVSGATRGTTKFAITGFTYLTGTRTTLAALSITGAADGTGIMVLGASSAGDGGGATYFWSASSTATPNGNTVIQPASLPGTGRWLKAVGGIGTPGISTLGGVFSNVGSLHQFVKTINTDGTVTLGQPNASDIAGLGTMALQASNNVSIGGGLIDNTTVGLTFPVAGRFTNLSATLQTIVGEGISSSNPIVVVNGGSNAGFGPSISFQRNFSVKGAIGTYSVLGAGTSDDLTYATNSGINHRFRVGGTDVATISNTGINSAAIGQTTAAAGAFTTLTSTGGALNGTIGATTPAASTFTTSNWNSGANRAATKANLNVLVVNVRDFGAIGNGVADDRIAINNAIATLTNYSTLYFPQGRYRITNSLTGLAGLNHVTFAGDGWSSEIFNATGALGSNTTVFASSCSFITVRDLAFTGNATTRDHGIHIRMFASDSKITNCYFQGSSDFAVFLSNDGATWSSRQSVTLCTFVSPLGDGVHVGSSTDVLIDTNQFYSTGDDSIGIVADDPAHPPTRVTVSHNNIFNAGSRGIALLEANDFLVDGNNIYTSQGAGIEMTRYLSTTNYCNRGSVRGNKLYNTTQIVGPLGAINVFFCFGVDVTNNLIQDPATGSGISYLDVLDVTISDNTMRHIPNRGINSDDGTTANVSNTWGPLYITNNKIQWTVNYEAIYVQPASGKTIDRFYITGNDFGTIQSGTAAYWNRVTNGRVVNNASMGLAYTQGGTASGVTAANNY